MNLTSCQKEHDNRCRLFHFCVWIKWWQILIFEKACIALKWHKYKNDMKMDNLNFLWNIAIFIRNDLSVHIILKILIQITSPPSWNDISSLYWGCVYWCKCNGAKLVQFLMDEIKSCPTVFVVVVFISRSCFPLIYVTQQGRKDMATSIAHLYMIHLHCSPQRIQNLQTN